MSYPIFCTVPFAIKRYVSIQSVTIQYVTEQYKTNLAINRMKLVKNVPDILNQKLQIPVRFRPYQ